MKSLDLRGVPCPRNASLALMEMTMLDEGETLEILLDDGDPITNVPESLELEGYSVFSQKQDAHSGHWVIQVKEGTEV